AVEDAERYALRAFDRALGGHHERLPALPRLRVLHGLPDCPGDPAEPRRRTVAIVEHVLLNDAVLADDRGPEPARVRRDMLTTDELRQHFHPADPHGAPRHDFRCRDERPIGTEFSRLLLVEPQRFIWRNGRVVRPDRGVAIVEAGFQCPTSEDVP